MVVSQRLTALLKMTLAAGLAFCAAGPVWAQFETQTEELETLLLRQNHRQGKLLPDQHPLHLAIDGVGFFAVRHPTSGERLYTRNGRFQQGAKGQIQSAEGFVLDQVERGAFGDAISAPLSLNPSTQRLLVLLDGSVYAYSDTDKIRTHQDFLAAHLGRILLTRFSHPEKLVLLSGHRDVYRAIPAAGDPVTGEAGKGGFGYIIGNALEDLQGPRISLSESPCKQENLDYVETGQALDLAIEGPGYFSVIDPLTGERWYTRQGRFKRHDADSRAVIATELGFYYLGYGLVPDIGIVMLDHYTIQRIDPDGTVKVKETAKNPANTGFNSDLYTIERIDPDGTIMTSLSQQEPERLRVILTVFENSDVLEPVSLGLQTLYRIKPELAESALPIDTYPGEEGAGTIKSGYYQACAHTDFIRLEPAPLNLPWH